MIYLILIFTVITRFLFLSDTPPSLNWDEISHGYNAYSILKNGYDEWGNMMPLIFRAYGDYKLPIYIYLTSVSEFFFGLNSFALRLPSVLAGIGIVYFGYLLTGLLFKNKTVATLTAFLIAIEPWTFFMGRPAFEANLGLFFFVLAVYLFLKSFDNPKKLIGSLISFGLTVWTYNSFRIFTPLFLVSLIVIYKDKFKEIYLDNKKLFKILILVAFIFFVPMFYQLISTTGSARYSKVAILDEGAINRINEGRQKYGRLVSNKLTYFGLEFAKSYISYFDPKFLFLKGGTQYQFSIPNTGLIYLINLPFLVYGIFKLLKIKGKEKYVLLFWILISPVAGSLTRESPHVLRAVTMLPIPMILTSLGLVGVLDLIRKESRLLFTLGYVVLILFSFENYLLKYFIDYKTNYSESWQYGYKEVSNYIEKNYDNYAKIVITKKYGEAHEFLLFYLKFDSKRYNADKNLNRFYQSGWWWVDSFDKFYFVNDWQIPKEGYKFIQESKKTVDCRQAKCLLVTSPDNAPKEWKKIDTIRFLNGNPAFELYENN